MIFKRAYFEVARNAFTLDRSTDSIAPSISEALELLGFKQTAFQRISTNNAAECHYRRKRNTFVVWDWQPHVITYREEKNSDESHNVEVRAYVKFNTIIIKLGILLGLCFLTYYTAGRALSLGSRVSTITSFNTAFYWLILWTVLVLIQALWGMKVVGMGIKHNRLFHALLDSFVINTKDSSIVHHGGRKFPSLELVVLLIYMLWGTSMISHMESFSSRSSSLLNIILGIACGLIIICLMAVAFMVASKEIEMRLHFVLLGLMVTVSYALFYNYPLIVSSVFPEFHRQMTLIQALDTAYHELGKPPEMEKGYRFLQNARIRFTQGSVAILMVLIVISLSLILSLRLKYLSSIIEKLRYSRKESIYHKALLPFKLFPLYSLLVFLLWLCISVAVVSATLLNVVLTILLFLPESVTLPFPITNNFLMVLNEQLYSYLGFWGYRILLSLYLLPFWLLLLYLYVLSVRELRYRKIFYRTCTKGGLRSKQIEMIVSELSEYLKISKPQIYFYPSLSVQSSTSATLWGNKKRLFLSHGTTLSLSNLELNALLAHEIYHIKNHTTIWGVLQFLSKTTLFGKGFLANMLNSYQIELSADKFALEWLKNKTGSKDNLIRLLSITEAVNALHGPGGIWQSIVNWQPEPKVEKINGSQKLTGSLKNMLDDMYLLYFSNQILSYVHPTIHERIEAINSME